MGTLALGACNTQVSTINWSQWCVKQVQRLNSGRDFRFICRSEHTPGCRDWDTFLVQTLSLICDWLCMHISPTKAKQTVSALYSRVYILGHSRIPLPLRARSIGQGSPSASGRWAIQRPGICMWWSLCVVWSLCSPLSSLRAVAVLISPAGNINRPPCHLLHICSNPGQRSQGVLCRSLVGWYACTLRWHRSHTTCDVTLTHNCTFLIFEKLSYTQIWRGSGGYSPRGDFFKKRDSKSWPLSYVFGTKRQILLQYFATKNKFLDIDGRDEASSIHTEYDKGMLVSESICKYWSIIWKGVWGIFSQGRIFENQDCKSGLSIKFFPLRVVLGILRLGSSLQIYSMIEACCCESQ